MNQNSNFQYPNLDQNHQQAPYQRMENQPQGNSNIGGWNHYGPLQSPPPPSQLYINQNSYNNEYNIWQNIKIIKKISLTVMIENWLLVFLAFIGLRVTFFILIVALEGIIFTVFYFQKANRQQATDQNLNNCRKILNIFLGIYVVQMIIQTVILANIKNPIQFPQHPEYNQREGYVTTIILYEVISTFIFLLPKIIVLSCTNDKFPGIQQPYPLSYENQRNQNQQNNIVYQGQQMIDFRQRNPNNNATSSHTPQFHRAQSH